MNGPTDMFGEALADMATRISQQALQTDPILCARLHSLSGNTVELQSTLPPVTWYLSVEDGNLQVHAGPAAAPQAIVRGSMLDLGAWLLPGADHTRLEVSGDNTLLLELAEILRSFSPDLSPMGKPLSDVLGEDLTTTLVGGAEMGVKALQSLLQGAGQTVQKQAADQFVQQPHLDDFLNGVDTLRLRIDRLAARVQQAEKQRREQTST